MTITANSPASYMPGRSPIHVKLFFERGAQRILGAQIVGREGVAKRIETVAAALQAGWTTYDPAALDMAYARPFSPAWDPLLVAVNAADR